MDRTELINKFSSDNEQRVLLSHIYDLWTSRNDRNVIRTSDFISESDLTAVKSMLNALYSTDHLIYGGYDGAERSCVVFLPDYFTKEDVITMPSLAEITYVRATVSKFDAPNADISHRDVLGSLMALGIERSTVGDIIANGQGAVFVVKSKLAEFLRSDFNRIGRYPVTVDLLESCEIKPIKDFEEGSDTVASMRLDAVVSSIFKISRSSASDYVCGGLVTVNGMLSAKPDMEVRVGDKLTLRGKGKAVIDRLEGTSKKGRIRFVYKKYK